MITIKKTQNPNIVKFEFETNAPDDYSIFDDLGNYNYEYKNIDEAKNSPLAQQLFYLPFIKTVYLSKNCIALEKFSIVEWKDVENEVAAQINDYISKGGKLLLMSNKTKAKQTTSVYGETTPNPNVLKFVVNKIIAEQPIEFKNINETGPSELAKEIFTFPYVKEIFIDENYISITKYETASWDEITLELRTFIKQYIENGGLVLDKSLLDDSSKKNITNETFEKLDPTVQRIINILEEYVKPAVQADGGNIAFESYNESNKVVKVTLQGACSGCPSSTYTLKSGIENMLKSMLNDEKLTVEAVNG